MLVVRTIKDTTNPLGKLVCPQQTVGFDHLALAVNPLRLDGVKPRALLRKEADNDPHALAADLDLAVVGTEPAPHLFGDMPARVVPDENPHLLTESFELFGAPPEKLGRYGTHRSAVDEPDPRLVESGQVEPITGDGLGVRVAVVQDLTLSSRLLRYSELISGSDSLSNSRPSLF